MHRFIQKLEAAGELIRIKEFTDPVLEIAEITQRICKQPGGGKALLFENTGTPFPVLTNMMGSARRMTLALGVDQLDDVPQRMEQLFRTATQPPQGWIDKIRLLPQLKEAVSWLPREKKGPGRCQEVVYPQPNLNLLPVLQSWPHDGGRFLTLPMVHTKDPQTGIRNVGMYRMQVFGPTTTGMHWHKHKTGARHFAQSTEKNFPVAICLGGNPLYAFCAAAPLPDGVDEYLLAGFLRNKPVNLVPCMSINLMVPEDCDFVLEGYIDRDALPVKEGPFGDHTGFYSLEDLYPLFQLTCLTHKKGAIYPATLTGIPPQEDAYFSEAIEKIFMPPLKWALAPELCDMHLPIQGVSHNLALLTLRKTYAGQTAKLAHAVWGAGQMMFTKIAVMLDEGVDIRNWEAVCDCLLQHYSPSFDSLFSRGPLDVLDHAAPRCGFGGKLCIDATSKLPEEYGAEKYPRPQTAIAFVHAFPEQPSALIEICLDPAVDLSRRDDCLWLVGNNADPIRDMRIEADCLRIDARSKAPGQAGVFRPWPNVVTASPATIQAVDAKWEKLGLGAFIPSPSLYYLQLVMNEGAEQGK